VIESSLFLFKAAGDDHRSNDFTDSISSSRQLQKPNGNRAFFPPSHLTGKILPVRREGSLTVVQKIIGISG